MASTTSTSSDTSRCSESIANCGHRGTRAKRNDPSTPSTTLIHESFVSGLGSDPGNTAIVRAIVGLGHGLGLTVVAEGVETEAQRSELHTLGCDSGQGYLFSPAVPPLDAASLLAGERSRA
jgi:EAL domain-containing protein (putative c-di-GMP-specific phosphodiesterase class I)